MKLVLAAVPHTHPTCPPLGPAFLSAYLQKKLPEVNVSVFDLSLEYYLRSFAEIQEGGLASVSITGMRRQRPAVLSRRFLFSGTGSRARQI